MDTKGIDFRNLNPAANQLQRQLAREQEPVKPINEITRNELRANADNLKRDQAGILGFLTDEEEARLASDIMAEHLSDSPDLESSWKFDEESHRLVIEIKDKTTGQVLRQIPPKEILSGNFVPELDANGNIINKIA